MHRTHDCLLEFALKKTHLLYPLLRKLVFMGKDGKGKEAMVTCNPRVDLKELRRNEFKQLEYGGMTARCEGEEHLLLLQRVPVQSPALASAVGHTTCDLVPGHPTPLLTPRTPARTYTHAHTQFKMEYKLLQLVGCGSTVCSLIELTQTLPLHCCHKTFNFFALST